MSPVKSRRSNGGVMVVDDNPANLKLMGDMLGFQGYEVRLFPRGRQALASAAQRPPDLILLDINMPEMDGYEVCRRLKADEALANIPVIFLSALQETQDKVKGLQCGGVDYITKPFQLEEVQARVETHLKIHDLQKALELHNEHLEEMVAARTRQLSEVNARLEVLDKAKNEFLNLISHEFRTPLHGLLGIGDLMLDVLPPTPQYRELIELFDISRQRILGILDDALLLTQIDVARERVASGPVPLCRVLHRALSLSAGLARERRVTLDPEPAPTGSEVAGEEGLLVTALHALMEAGLKLATPGTRLVLRHELSLDRVQLLIECEGQTVPESHMENFFDLFSMNEAVIGGVHLGLRPAVAYRILTLFGGDVHIVNRGSGGVCLTATLQLRIPPRV